MKVVFDINVLISAFLTVTGPSQYAFKLAAKRHSIFLSPFILDELRTKLVHKLKFSSQEVERTFIFLKTRVEILDIKRNPKIQFVDKKDIPILSLLESVSAHYFITGDKRLLELKKFDQTLILSPRESLRVL